MATWSCTLSRAVSTTSLENCQHRSLAMAKLMPLLSLVTSTVQFPCRILKRTVVPIFNIGHPMPNAMPLISGQPSFMCTPFFVIFHELVHEPRQLRFHDGLTCRVVNVSSTVSLRALQNSSPKLQQKFTSDTIMEEELVGPMNKFMKDTKNEVHIKEGWPDIRAMAYAVSKMGITVLSRIHTRKLGE
ncbi:hypothetical protein HPG69_016146 [Diceros bicornis minor]|uniref:Uncharacterized protein n=1 Tax=Diceros bicornis minor TaxID=77932 RepID=A0A7J7FHR0_DICBM|nr:hypothetical protein HPG69_016146 [Diceros bicornis minor]